MDKKLANRIASMGGTAVSKKPGWMKKLGSIGGTVTARNRRAELGKAPLRKARKA